METSNQSQASSAKIDVPAYLENRGGVWSCYKCNYNTEGKVPKDIVDQLNSHTSYYTKNMVKEIRGDRQSYDTYRCGFAQICPVSIVSQVIENAKKQSPKV